DRGRTRLSCCVVDGVARAELPEGNWSYWRQMMDLLTRIEASLDFMNDGGPIRVDFVNLREVLKGSREALLVMQQIEEALRHGFSVEPGSFLHDEVTRLCSGALSDE